MARARPQVSFEEARTLAAWFVGTFLGRDEPQHERREADIAAKLLERYTRETIKATCVSLRAGAYSPIFEQGFASLAYLTSARTVAPGLIRSPVEMERAREKREAARATVPELTKFRTDSEAHLYAPRLDNEEDALGPAD